MIKLSEQEQQLADDLRRDHKHVRIYRSGDEIHLRRQAMTGSCGGKCCAEYFVIRGGGTDKENK